MLLKNNKIAQSGDFVTESQLTSSAKDLESKGFIEKAKTEKTAEQIEAEEKAAEEAFKKDFEEGKLTAEQLDSITMKEIYDYAKKHSLKYDEDAKKAALIDQVLKAEKVEA